MKRQRNRIPCDRNNKWYERYGQKGFFCMPRAVFFNIVDCIDNATFYCYVALASCHFEGNTTYAASHIAKLVGKDESNVRGHLADLETLGLIRREPLGRGFKILFECPTRQRVKEGAKEIAERKSASRLLRTTKRLQEFTLDDDSVRAASLRNDIDWCSTDFGDYM